MSPFKGFLLSMLLLPSIPAFSSLQPENLLCENKINPLGINAINPLLSWNLTSQQRNQIQTAYEIVIDDNLSDINQHSGKVWSTGKIMSSQSINLPYTGKPLNSFTRYYWTVRVYDGEDHVSNWSPVAWFETAMLKDTEWKATWISDGSQSPAKDEDAYNDDPMPLFRKEFKASKKIEAARLFISGLGYYEAYLNGKKVSDNMLDPGWTTYKQQVFYVVHDITAHVQQGINVAGVMLGNGWWNPLPFKLFGRWDIRDYQQTGRPCLKAEIHVRYADGSSDIISTDDTWLTTSGPILRNNVYLGEYYDARREIKNWNKQGEQNAGWKNATKVSGPEGRMMVQMQAPVRMTRVVKPIAIREQEKGVYIVDMGQNFAGVVRIKVKGPAGTTIRLRSGEGIFPDGSINLMTAVATQIKKGGIKGGPGAPETAWQEDRYTLKGSGLEIWSPRFTFHGFQYIEVRGWPGKPTLDDIEGLRLNADLNSAGTFSSSNEMFNRLHDIIQWTFLSNVFSVQSDCPAREKFGYGADLVVSANAFIYNYDMTNFYRKAVQDFANDQQSDGGITELSPFIGIADRGYGGDSGPLGWQLAFPFLQKQLYDYYGDKRIIEQHYEGVKRQLQFLETHAINGLYHWDISDHEALDPRPEAFSASAFYYHHALLGAEFAGIMDQHNDSIRYAKLAQTIKRNIVDRYYIKGTGRFDNATQSAQVMALWYDLSPEKELTYNILLEEFKRHQWHVSSGIFGVKMMFDVLRERNQNEIAYRIANQRDYPGWGHMLESGATTLWETWKFPETGPSRNHPMFGSIDEWFYRSLLGINPGAPGFKQIILKPQPAGDLTWAKGSYKSVRGEIISDWKIENGKFLYHVRIPVNTTAKLYIPSSNGMVSANGRDQQGVQYENGYAVFNIGSGEYHFVTDYLKM
jgi:alpha-L-rhamnosidase